MGWKPICDKTNKQTQEQLKYFACILQEGGSLKIPYGKITAQNYLEIQISQNIWANGFNSPLYLNWKQFILTIDLLQKIQD